MGLSACSVRWGLLTPEVQLQDYFPGACPSPGVAKPPTILGPSDVHLPYHQENKLESQ